MKKVVISPFSKKLRNGENNPKNYPHWQKVINLLKNEGIYVIQVGRSDQGETIFEANETQFDLSQKDLQKLVKTCDSWACVDNFFHHMCSLILDKPGVVVWGKSNPDIFGYSHNINLLKGKSYLRVKQFDIWEHEKYNPNCWVSPEKVFQSIVDLLNRQ